MSLQGSIFKLNNLWNNCKLTSIFKYWNNFQPSIYFSQSLEEKYNIPPKPKRPLTPYLRYALKIRPEIKNSSPTAKTTDIMRETALRWEKVDPELKKSLEAEYANDQAVYSKVRLEYDTKLTQEQKMALKQIKIEKMEIKEKRKQKKKNKEMNKPKRPGSAFIHFLKSQLDTRGSENFTNWVSAISLKWKALSNTEKEPYLQETKRQLIEYQKNMVEWERKMIRMGNTELVRKDAMIEPKLKPKPLKKE